jgi:hypothetical protein
MLTDAKRREGAWPSSVPGLLEAPRLSLVPRLGHPNLGPVSTWVFNSARGLSVDWNLY